MQNTVKARRNLISNIVDDGGSLLFDLFDTLYYDQGYAVVF